MLDSLSLLQYAHRYETQVNVQSELTLNEIVDSVHFRADQLWGHDYAAQIPEVIRSTAEDLFRLEQHSPPSNTEPTFYP